LWERPRDVSRVITHLLGDKTFAPLIDPNAIFMGGHSLGGWTAVWLAGGRYDGEKVKAECAADPSDLICEIGDMWRIAKTPEDTKAMEHTLNAIKTPLLVFGAPKPSMGALDLDRESRALVAQLPKETTRYIEPATLTHFDFLGVCTERGMEILDRRADRGSCPYRECCHRLLRLSINETERPLYKGAPPLKVLRADQQQ